MLGLPMSDPAVVKPIVVYVDDERGNRVVFEQSLGAEFTIETFAEGAQALARLEQGDVGVLLTDMRMPTMDGEELLRIAKERFPQTIRMVVTAYSDVDPILRAINEGLVARYIVKPWVRTELMQVLRWAIEAYTFGRDSAALHRRLLETERLATLGSVAGHFVHDLKQPLMSLFVNIDQFDELAKLAPTLRTLVEQSAVPDRERLLGLIDDLSPLATDMSASANHLSELINNLRDFIKPVRGPRTESITDPLPIVRHAMSVCDELAVAVGASISYDGPRTLPQVRMSATELTQVLVNVVSNSAQAVAARGPAKKGKVSIVARTEGGMLELTVRDDGVGMPPEILKRVGTPFFTTREAGTGLGIAQCQRLVGTAGGRIRIDSEQGIGTSVTITLPTAA